MRLFRLGAFAMSHDPSKPLRSKLAAYLSHRISLRAFRRWFISASWNVAKWASADLCDKVYGIEMHLMEHENGHLTERELREKLLPFVANVSISDEEEPKRTLIIDRSFWLKKPVSQTQPAVACG